MPQSHKILRAGALPRPRPGPESGGLSRLAHECLLPENSARTERLGKERKGGHEFRVLEAVTEQGPLLGVTQ